MPSQEHWEKVYTSKSAESVSWFQPHAATSLRLRDLLLSSDLFVSGDAERIYRLDRTAIVIEVDALIDCRGDETRLEILLAE